jgi:hypothetical protein
MGKLRDLTTVEILAQMFYAKNLQLEIYKDMGMDT